MGTEGMDAPVVRHPEYIYMDYGRHLSSRLKRSMTGPMWHGPSLREALDGCTADDALERPLRQLPCIWDIVLHVTARAERARLHMDGLALEDPTREEDWPSIRGPLNPDAWTDAQARLNDAYKAMATRVLQVVSSGFLQVAENSGCNIATMADGVVEHGAYHAAQIVLIRKELRSRGPRRGGAMADVIW